MSRNNWSLNVISAASASLNCRCSGWSCARALLCSAASCPRALRSSAASLISCSCSSNCRCRSPRSSAASSSCSFLCSGESSFRNFRCSKRPAAAIAVGLAPSPSVFAISAVSAPWGRHYAVAPSSLDVPRLQSPPDHLLAPLVPKWPALVRNPLQARHL